MFEAGEGWTPLALFQRLLLGDDKGAPGHPGQDSTLLDLRPLGQACVRAVLVQADTPLGTINSPYRTQPILGMANQRASLQPERTRAAIRLAQAPFGRLQAM